MLFYGFDDLTPLQLDAIETLGRVVDAPVTVSLAYEAGPHRLRRARAAPSRRSRRSRDEHRALPAREDHYAPHSRAALAHLERSLFEPGAARVAPGAAVALLQGGGERAELELVAARVAALLREGWRAEEIAVVVRNPAALRRRSLAEVFARGRGPDRDAGQAAASPTRRPAGR